MNKLYEYQTESFAESLSYFPSLNSYNTGTKEYLELLEAAKAKVTPGPAADAIVDAAAKGTP